MGENMLDSAKRKKDRRIILGLTGPIGSGCTELARVFDSADNPDREVSKCDLLNFLMEEGYIKINWTRKEIIPVHNEIDRNIERLTHDISNLNEEISSKKIVAEKEEIKKERRHKFNALKEKLEYRETLKSLEYLEQHIDFDKRQHKFTTISLSDLIVFNMLCNYWRKPKYPKEFKNRKIVDNFLGHLKTKENELKKIIDKIKHLSPQAKGLHGIRRLLNMRKKLPPDEIDEIASILWQIEKLSEAIKGDFQEINREEYRTVMQDFGDNIRRCGNPFNYMDDYKKDNHEKWCQDIESIINFLYFRRGYSFFIIDSFRNPYEALYFQRKYTDFYLISMFASEKRRRERLKRVGIQLIEEDERRDQGKGVEYEEIFFKQHVPRTVKLADIAINNKSDEKDVISKRNKLVRKVVRYLALIFDAGCTKPNNDEVMINLAYTMAMKSNCISRQVGAVIIGKEGYVVGAGWNDVGEGQISCGLREIKDLESGSYDEHVRVFLGKDADYIIKAEDRQEVIRTLMKDYMDKAISMDEIEKFCFCFKDKFSQVHVHKKAKATGILDKCSAEEINKLGIKRLEYCQALHAEENAIIQGAKIGGMGLQGASIYTTAFPCELCAKKIHQVGIKKIIYTEPYPGNISEQIYLKSPIEKIESEQFEGVMPKGYFKLFKVTEDQKDWQDLRSKKFVD
jgi:deoxycytidylate deaminase